MRIRKEFAIVMLTVLITSCSCFEPTPEAGVKFSTVDEVAQTVTKPSTSTVVLDVNPESVRNKKGVIPNAIKLSSYDKYALTELPADKNTGLIFYLDADNYSQSEIYISLRQSNIDLLNKQAGFSAPLKVFR